MFHQEGWSLSVTSGIWLSKETKKQVKQNIPHSPLTVVLNKFLSWILNSPKTSKQKTHLEAASGGACGLGQLLSQMRSSKDADPELGLSDLVLKS